MDNQLLHIAEHFALGGKIASIDRLGEGFINDTLTITMEGSSRPDYILQRKNHNVFPDVPAMMDNIYRVTNHIKAKIVASGGDPMRETLTIVPALDGKLYHKDKDGNYWAVCVFIKDSVTHDRADTPELAYKGGEGLGLFQSQLADFTEPLAETIPGFLNIKFRFTQWDEAIAADAAGRVKDLKEEISWVESRRQKMLDFWHLVETGELPMRVTHNDTKLSNVLFNKDDSVLCMIDLDTCMSSTALNDVGDALRSYTNTGAEDDKDLDKVSMNLEIYKAYMAGYLSKMRDKLTPKELEMLPFAGIYITFEQVLRFLMDYINGDTYYRIAYPEHNLVRTRAQYKLLTSMESQWEEMKNI